MKNVTKKLQAARLELQAMNLKKTGKNEFAKYSYFELGDFLPQTQEIFGKIGLCGFVSFAADLATLTITDTDSGEFINITSPMAEATLKGCHPIQNLGATETYSRRYLWAAAMELVEHDMIDSSEPIKPQTKPEPKKEPKPEMVKLHDLVMASKEIFSEYEKVKKSLNEESQKYFWALFSPAERELLKSAKAAMIAKDMQENPQP